MNNHLDKLLPEDAFIPRPFVLLDQITKYTPDRAEARACLARAAAWQALEATAQLASYHFRRLNNHAVHTFLVSVRNFILPEPDNTAQLSRLEVDLLHAGTYCAEYRVQAHYEQVDRPADDHIAKALSPSGGVLLIGARKFDDFFKKEVLTAHYKKQEKIFAQDTR